MSRTRGNATKGAIWGGRTRGGRTSWRLARTGVATRSTQVVSGGRTSQDLVNCFGTTAMERDDLDFHNTYVPMRNSFRYRDQQTYSPPSSPLQNVSPISYGSSSRINSSSIRSALRTGAAASPLASSIPHGSNVDSPSQENPSGSREVLLVQDLRKQVSDLLRYKEQANNLKTQIALLEERQKLMDAENFTRQSKNLSLGLLCHCDTTLLPLVFTYLLIYLLLS